MASSATGRLGQRLLPDLLKDAASRKLTGFVRLSRERATKTIFFDSGRAINAFSSLPSEQLETRLLKEGRTTPGLLDAVKRSQPNPMLLGPALVEKGLISADVVKKAGAEIASQVLHSLWDWPDASYELEESRVSVPRVFEIDTVDLVVNRTRSAAASPDYADVVAPLHKKGVRAELTADDFGSTAKLTSLESYLLSLFTAPIALSEVCGISGLPDEEIRPALSVLVVTGLVTLIEEREAPPIEQPAAPKPPDPMLEGITRKLQQFETANYYQILGVDKFATTATINNAFDGIVAMFDSYRNDTFRNAELQSKLYQLFTKIKGAYAVLSDPVKRSEYDRPAGASLPPPAKMSPPALQNSGARVAVQDGVRRPVQPRGVPKKPVPIQFNIPTPVAPKGSQSANTVIDRNQAAPPPRKADMPPPRTPIPIPEIKMPVAPKNGNGMNIERGQSESTRRQAPVAPRPITGPLIRPPAVLSPEEQARLKNPSPNSVAEQALHFYRQGRARFERRELDAAEHLLREAVRLDPGQPHYHYHLGVILTIRAQARKEHIHHEGCHVTCKLGGKLVSNLRVRYEAEQHFLKAAEIDPSNAQILLKLGMLYKDARLLKKAEQFLKQALLLDSRNHVAKRELEMLHSDPSAEEEEEELQVELED